jgi:hypothetical protein
MSPADERTIFYEDVSPVKSVQVCPWSSENSRCLSLIVPMALVDPEADNCTVALSRSAVKVRGAGMSLSDNSMGLLSMTSIFPFYTKICFLYAMHAIYSEI